MRIEGLAQTRRAMEQLPRRIDRQILNAGLLAAARPVRDAARDLAPVLVESDPRWMRGAIRRAIRATRIRPRQYAAEVVVSVRNLRGKARASAKKKLLARIRQGHAVARRNGTPIVPGDAFWWFFQEFGWTDAAGRKHGGRAFMRRAFEAKKKEGVEAAIKLYRERVQAAIAKLGPR